MPCKRQRRFWMQNKFHIDNFRPKRLKESRLALDEELIKFQAWVHANKEAKNKKNESFLKKISKLFKKVFSYRQERKR